MVVCLLLAKVYLNAVKSCCQGEVLGKRTVKFITNLSILIFFHVSGDISCPYPFCKRKFQSQYEFTPRALEQHLDNSGNWHEGIILTIIIKLLHKRFFVKWSTNGTA